jgi:hypothetical protein
MNPSEPIGPMSAPKDPEWADKVSTPVKVVSPIWVQPVKLPVSKPGFTTRLAAAVEAKPAPTTKVTRTLESVFTNLEGDVFFLR